MDKRFIIVYIFIIILAFILLYFEYETSFISGLGGILASLSWIYFIFSSGLKGKEFEFLAAFIWAIFSIAVICAKPF